MLQSAVAWHVTRKVFRIQSYNDTVSFNEDQGLDPPDKRWILIKIDALEFLKNQDPDEDLREIEDMDPFHKVLNLPESRCIEFSGSKKDFKQLSPETVTEMDREKLFFDPIFKPKPENNSDSRFSDGSFPVFYSSLKKETAKAESCYWDNTLSDWDKPFLRVLFSCEFSGNIKDFQSSTYPKLKQNRGQANGYAFCQELGKQSSGDRLYGLLVPSARHLDGVNLPVFSRYALCKPYLENYSDPRKKDYFDISCNPKKNRRMP